MLTLSVFCTSAIDGMSVSPCFVFLRAQNRDFPIFCPLVSFYIEIFSHQPNTNTAFILSAGNSEFLFNGWKESDFPFSRDTSPCSEYKLPLFRGVPLFLHLVQIHFFIFCWKHVRAARPWLKQIWTTLACILCVKSVKPGSPSIKHSFLKRFLGLGYLLESTREVDWGEAQVKWKCHSFVSTCSGHIGKVISRLWKEEQKNQWILPAWVRSNPSAGFPEGALDSSQWHRVEPRCPSQEVTSSANPQG